jgi:uncharacterized protein (TIRG00374 family)
VLWRADPGAVLRAGRGADVGWIAIAVALVAADRSLMAYRWVVLLRALDPDARPRLGAILRVFFLSTFTGTFLPSIGGDVVRAYSLSSLGVSGAASTASVLMDRLLGVLSILILGAAAAWSAGGSLVDRGMIVTLGAATLFCIGAAVVVFNERAATLLGRVMQLAPWTGWQRFAQDLVAAVRRYSRHQSNLANVLTGSVLVQALRVIQAWCLGRALGIDLSLGAYFVFIPLILLIMLLPITINGLGTSQVAFVWFLGRAGVPPPAAFALSVLFVALGIVGNLPGGILFAIEPAHTRRANV